MRRRRKKRRPSDQKEKRITPQLLKEIASFVILTAAAVLLATALALAFGARMDMSGRSMEPTIANGQRLLINRLAYQISTPKRGDIVVFYGSGNRMRAYVKRVVAVGGDTVKITDGTLYVNGAPQDDTSFDKMEDAGIASNEITLGAGEYFVLGDNRNNSEDSRSANIGVVRRDTITGKVWRVY